MYSSKLILDKHIQKAIFAMILILFIAIPAQSRDYWGKVKGNFTGHVTMMAVDGSDRVYAATWGGGIYRSDNDGVSWTAFNTGLTNLFVNCIKMDANNIWLGTEGGGVFISTNFGNSWTQMVSGLTNLNVRALNIKSNGYIFAGTYGNGVFISEDDGLTWKASNTGLHYQDIISIGFAVTEDYVILGTNGGGIYRSSDNGKIWKRSNVGFDVDFINQFMLNSVDEVLAASNGGGILISVDNGLSWKEFDTNTVDKNIQCFVLNSMGFPVVAARYKGVMYYEGMNYERWFRSNLYNGGATALAVNSDGVIFAAVPFEGIYKSTNHGEKFDYVGFKYDKGVKPIKASKISGTLFAVFNQTGGAFRSNDNGKTWQQKGLTNEIINCFYFDRNDNVYAGTNRGIYRSMNMGDNWTHLGLDSIILSILVVQNTVLAGGSNFYKSTTGAAPWTIISIGMGGSINDLALHQNGDLYSVGRGDGLWKSSNLGDNWTQVFATTETGYQEALYIHPQGRLFLGTFNGVFRSLDTGATWVQNTLGVQYPWVRFLEADIAGKLYAGLDYQEGIFHTTNQGSDWDSTNNSFSVAAVQGLGANSDGYTFMATDIIYKSIAPVTLNVPILVSPANATTGLGVNPALVWRTTNKAEMYELQLSSADDFTFRDEFVVLADTFRVIEKTLDSYTTYYWRVRSKTHSALGPWSDIRSFTTTLSVPVLISPEDGKKGVPQDYDFLWHIVLGADSYKMEISKSPDFAEIYSTIEDITDTTTQASNLEPLTTYYWRVNAKSGDVTGAWSQIWSFQTVVAPPALRAPENHSMELPTSVTFRWDTSNAADKYFIQIAKDPEFMAVIFEGQAESKNSQQFNLLEYNTKYYWRVYASNNDGRSIWAEAWDFTTGIAPPVLISPENDLKNTPHTLSFKWEQFEQADLYHIQIASDKDFKTIAFEDSTLSLDNREFSNLDGFTVYWWRVRVKIDERWGFFSAAWSFRTNLKSPVLTSPDDKAVEQPRSLYLKWNAAKGADRYHVQVATDDVFQNMIQETPGLTTIQQGLVDLPAQTTIYWRIKSLNDETESDWSTIRSFTTQMGSSVAELPQGIRSIEVYPTPAIDFSNIIVELNEPADIEVKVMDLNGRVVSELFNGWSDGSDLKFIWRHAHFASGLYKINLKINGHAILRDVMIVR